MIFVHLYLQGHYRLLKSEGRMKSSITDWIQAIAVTIGIFFAIQEYVLKDRVQERLKKEEANLCCNTRFFR